MTKVSLSFKFYTVCIITKNNDIFRYRFVLLHFEMFVASIKMSRDVTCNNIFIAIGMIKVGISHKELGPCIGLSSLKYYLTFENILWTGLSFTVL